MSWHFSWALVAEYWGASSSGGEPSATWYSSPTALDDSASDKMKDTCHRSPFGTMYVPSTDAHDAALLMWYRAAFPARTSVLPSSVEETGWTASAADSGVRWRGSFARWD